MAITRCAGEGARIVLHLNSPGACTSFLSTPGGAVPAKIGGPRRERARSLPRPLCFPHPAPPPPPPQIVVLDKLDYCATLHNLQSIRKHRNFKVSGLRPP